MKFNDLKLPQPILRALAEQGYETPTPIQEQAIPPALEGRDVLGCARTGTGKTCAFATPILTLLDREHRKDHPIRALVLTPTRELALQNQECFAAYGAYLPLRSTVIFGGVGQGPQVEALQKGTDILVATPGRLADLYQQGYIDLSQLEIFVLDEADRMLDMGFIHDVKKILQWLPDRKQTLFFSATMPQEVQQLVSQLLHSPARIAVDPVNSTVDAIDQRLYRTDKSKKTKLLTWLLSEQDYPSVLVFTRTKHGANRVARDLERAGIAAAAIHGNKSQTARQAALADFKSGKLRVLVATDIAARGLDIEGLSCVVNYNLPDVPETYVHRIGRTGRAGQDGIALSFCDASELDELAAIEKQLGNAIPNVQQHPYPMEEMEVPMTDKRGRRIHPEDAEARAAAREQSQSRREKRRQPPQAQEEAPSQTQPKTERAPEAQPKQSTKRQKRSTAPAETAPAPKAEGKAPAAKPSRKPGPQAAKQPATPDESVLRPEEDVGDYRDLIRHRANSHPAARKPYSAAALDELLALPDFADELGYGQIGKSRSKRKPISGGKVMDATARMFMQGHTEPEPPAAPSKGEKRRPGRRQQIQPDQTPAPKAEDKAAPAKQPAKNRGKKSPAKVPEARSGKQAATPQQRTPKAAAKLASAPKQAPKPAARRKAALSKASEKPVPTPEASKSLVRPYYLSDQKGKR